MKRFHGNEAVGSGVYFNSRQFSFKSIERGGKLPGGPTDEYFEVPWVVLLVAGPFLGLTYVMFLPLLGIVMAAWLLAGKLREVTSDLADRASRVLRPGWEPSHAFLSRSEAAPDADEPRRERDAWSEEVRTELTDKR